MPFPGARTFPGKRTFPGGRLASYPDEPLETIMGSRLRERTQPLAPDDERYGFAHAWLCEAISALAMQAQQVADPDGDVPPLAPILSPDYAPDWALPWVAQLVGIQLPAGIDPDRARLLIKDASGFRRGTRDSIRAVANSYLTGTQQLYFRERDEGDAYALEIVTLTSETPDPDALLAAITAQKPGGIVLRYRTISGWDYEALRDTGDTYAETAGQYDTYQNLAYKEPNA
jgi:hypothetical protein